MRDRYWRLSVGSSILLRRGLELHRDELGSARSVPGADTVERVVQRGSGCEPCCRGERMPVQLETIVSARIRNAVSRLGDIAP